MVFGVLNTLTEVYYVLIEKKSFMQFKSGSDNVMVFVGFVLGLKVCIIVN